MSLLNSRIEIVKTDITQLKVDAIVNAANSKLAGGGGVDGAIHKAAGPLLANACSHLGGCKTGEAVITPGFNLPAKYVIHTVGPVWRGGRNNEQTLLASCYNSSLGIATKNGIKTIAFPNISTGIYGFPKNEAASIAVNTITRFLENNNTIDLIKFVCFDSVNYDIYYSLLK